MQIRDFFLNVLESAFNSMIKIEVDVGWIEMVRIYAKRGNFGILNPLNPPYQGDFKRKCVSRKEVKKGQF